MKTVTITKNSNLPIDAKHADTRWIVDTNVVITAPDGKFAIDAHSAHDGRDFLIRGKLKGATDNTGGILLGDESSMEGGARVVITKTGEISASIGVNAAAEDAFIHNAGEITGMMGIASAGEGSLIRNLGLIATTDTGISFGLGDQLVVNDGVIGSGKMGVVAYYGAGHTGRIVNNGEITGGEAGVFIYGNAPGKIIIENHGTITGGSYAAIGGVEGVSQEVVVNRGEISGSVLLRGGNDTYDGRDGIVGGGVYGGDGNDTYYVDNKLTNLIESSTGGFDTIKSEISWQLDKYFENLVLIGNNAISGTGNDDANKLTGNSASNTLKGGGGADIINGGGGKDQLYGGAQADVFVFTKGCSGDYIRDFQDGTDRLDFSGYAGIDKIQDLTSRMHDYGNDLVINLGHGDLVRIGNMHMNQFSDADVLL